MRVPALSYWRILATPDWPLAVGQGDMPAGPAVTLPGADGESHTLHFTWGQLLRASANCDPERGLATLTATPTALVRTGVVAHLHALGLAEPVAGDFTSADSGPTD